MYFELDNFDNYFGIADGMGFNGLKPHGLKTLSTKVEVQQRRKSTDGAGVVVTDVRSRKIHPINGENGLWTTENGVPVVSN